MSWWQSKCILYNNRCVQNCIQIGWDLELHARNDDNGWDLAVQGPKKLFWSKNRERPGTGLTVNKLQSKHRTQSLCCGKFHSEYHCYTYSVAAFIITDVMDQLWCVIVACRTARLSPMNFKCSAKSANSAVRYYYKYQCLPADVMRFRTR